MTPRFAFHSFVAVACVAFLPSFVPPSRPQGDPAQASRPKPVRLGAGTHRYEWVPDWAKLPQGVKFGNTHGCITFDKRGRVYVNTDSDNAVMVFEPDGAYVKGWGKELRGGLHSMVCNAEKDGEFLYLAHHSTRKVYKTTLDGAIVWELGCPMESGVYEREDQFHPTTIVVAPDGSFFVGDGYGLSYVHKFDANRKFVKTIAGPGSERGKVNCPHGMWIDTRSKDLTLVVADRANHRLQIFDLDGKLLRVVEGDLRLPSNFGQRGPDLAIADLEGRVTILDADFKVITHLGDNPDPKKRAQNGVPSSEWRAGEFIAPHCARWDADGNLYVMDWLAEGRVSKLKRLKD
jgi:DNA-binding beta-propeller fold protein YncE